jgi:AraC-like DNA-binding protein
MATIKDRRVVAGKQSRNGRIREYFEKRFNAGMRYEVIMDEIISQWGLSESTVSRIIKRSGGYAV